MRVGSGVFPDVRGMSGRLKLQRVRKELLAARVARMVRSYPLSAVVHTGNLDFRQKSEVRAAILGLGGEITFTKNTVTAKGFEQAGAHGLVPALHGPTALASGPAEVPLADALFKLSSGLPDFFVLAALLDQRRLLQFWEVERLAKLPPAEQVHAELVAQMLPGSALRIPSVSAYLLATLKQRVSQLESTGTQDAQGQEPPPQT